jgi:copper chaperone NosL
MVRGGPPVKNRRPAAEPITPELMGTMRIEKRSQLAALVVLVALAACAPRAGGPPEIVIDRTACAHCSMLISEPRYAAAYRVDGTDKAFDDIGCLLDALEGEPAGAAVQLWFRDVHDGAWIEPDAATFVSVPGMQTPMIGGIVATAHAGELESLKGRPGATVYTSLQAVRAARSAVTRSASEGNER